MSLAVADLMTTTVLTLPLGSTLEDAILFERKHRIRHIPIVDGGRLVGLVTDRDLKQASPSVVAGTAPDEYQRILQGTFVDQVMVREPLTIRPDTPLVDAVKIFLDRRFSSLPVVEDGVLIGILTATDALRALMALLETPRR